MIIPPSAAIWHILFFLCLLLIAVLFLRPLLSLLSRKPFKIPAAYPGRGWPSFVRNALDFVTDQIGTVKTATDTCGNVFSIQILNVYTVWLRGNELNKVYVNTREDVWSFVGGMGVFLNKIIDHGYWNHYKVLLASMSRYINRVAAQENAIRLTTHETKKHASAWGRNEQGIKLFDSMSRMVHSIIVQSLMGEDFYQHNAQELIQLLQAMEADLGSPLSFLLPDWVPHPPAMRLRRARQRMKEIFLERLSEREAAAAAGMASKGEETEVEPKTEDYIAFTLRDKLTKPLKDLMPSHHTLLMFAAHTSTSASISWNVIELLRHPHIMRRLTDELRSNPEANDSVLLQACIKETSRCYTGMRLLRLARQDVQLPETGCHIRKGSIVSISPYLTHHDPRNFPNPDEWIPERWISQGKIIDQVNNTPPSDGVKFMPFGGGSHRCVGEKLARIMVSHSLATVLRGWDVEWADEEVVRRTDLGDLNFDKVGTPWPRKDVSICVKRRDGLND